MTCRMGELRCKEVVSTKDGARLGYVCDLELDGREGRVLALVIYGRPRLFGLLGRAPDTVIPWREVSLVGEQTVLVNRAAPQKAQAAGGLRQFLEKIGL